MSTHALLDLRLMFPHQHMERWKAIHLTAFYLVRHLVLQGFTATITYCYSMNNRTIWMLHHLQRINIVSLLTTRLTSCLLAQALRGRLVNYIRGRWLIVIAAILSQAIFQFLEPGFQLHQFATVIFLIENHDGLRYPAALR